MLPGFIIEELLKREKSRQRPVQPVQPTIELEIPEPPPPPPREFDPEPDPDRGVITLDMF